MGCLDCLGAKTKLRPVRWLVLVERYRETTAWTDLSLATRRQGENILRHVLEKAGNQPVSKITRAHIVDGRDRRAATPAQARHFIDTMRGLYVWATEVQHVKTDPTLGVKYPKQPKTGGFAPWTDEDIAAYERRWPIGTWITKGCSHSCCGPRRHARPTECDTPEGDPPVDASDINKLDD
jgi:hypothetical protein